MDIYLHGDGGGGWIWGWSGWLGRAVIVPRGRPGLYILGKSEDVTCTYEYIVFAVETLNPEGLVSDCIPTTDTTLLCTFIQYPPGSSPTKANPGGGDAKRSRNWQLGLPIPGPIAVALSNTSRSKPTAQDQSPCVSCLAPPPQLLGNGGNWVAGASRCQQGQESKMILASCHCTCVRLCALCSRFLALVTVLRGVPPGHGVAPPASSEPAEATEPPDRFRQHGSFDVGLLRIPYLAAADGPILRSLSGRWPSMVNQLEHAIRRHTDELLLVGM